MFDNKEKEARELNCRCFMATLDSIQYLARQRIPLRGHGSDEDSNFLQLLMMKSKEFPELKSWLEKKQGKFVTHDVQNEILTIMSNSVLRSLLKKIEGKIYSTLCDEYTDCSNHKQLIFCLHWAEALKAHETFLGFCEIPNIKSSTIVSVIKYILTKYQLSLENFRGQCYDGASNMLGKTSGVAVKLQKLQPKADYTHCYGHSLSLTVKDVTKKVKILGDTMVTAREIIVLIKYSPERENLMEKIKKQIKCNEEVEIKVNSISKLSKTRWTVCAECFKSTLDNYKKLMTLWKFCLENNNMATEVIVGVRTVKNFRVKN